MTTAINPHHVVGSLGSDFWRLEVPPQLVPALASRLDWNQMGRRVMIDAMNGIIVWMSPSSSHEDFATASEKVVSVAASILKMRVNEKRGTRWRRPNDPKNSGMEADAAFYIGKSATQWYTLFKERGRKAVHEFEVQTPPDLVVEVEVTHFDQDKPERYTKLGVREMWRIDDRKGNEQPQIEILALQKTDEPKMVDTSSVLIGLPSSILPQAFWFAMAGEDDKLNALLHEHISSRRTPRRLGQMPETL